MSELSATLPRPLGALRRYATVYFGLLLLGVICLTWSIIALPACYLMPRRAGAQFGRRGIHHGFGLYVRALRLLQGYRLDLSELQALKHESGIILAPNHPHLVDALLLLSEHPNLVCVMKTQLMQNPFLGAGSRLARFIRNDPPRRLIAEAIVALREGGVLLLFPEGTRTVRFPVNPCQLTTAAISKHAQAPVQTLLIETDSPYLSKGWTLFHVPELPITYRIRLGRRFAPPTDVRGFTAELEAYFRAELAHAPQRAWLDDLHAQRTAQRTEP
jgi:1-acyl-sn-glycerol-3-phosphate acyltransferase